MNTKQSETWGQLVQQCEIQITEQPYSRINVASQVRSNAIVAAGALVELVTPKLAAALVRLANFAVVAQAGAGYDYRDWYDKVHSSDIDDVRALAACIREALAQEANDD